MDKRKLLEQVKAMTREERMFAERALPVHWPEIREAVFYDESTIGHNAAISLQRLLDGWFVEETVDGPDIQKPFTHIVMRRPEEDVQRPKRFHDRVSLEHQYRPMPTVFQPVLDPSRINPNEPRPPVTQQPLSKPMAQFFERRKLVKDCKKLRLYPPPFGPNFEEEAKALIAAKEQADRLGKDFVQERQPQPVTRMVSPGGLE